MPRYERPEWALIDPAELCEYLLEQGIISTVAREADLLAIYTEVDASAALAAFTPTSSVDPVTGFGDYITGLPLAFREHAVHLRDFRAAVRAGTDGSITDAQLRHVVADVIDAIRLLDARLERDA